MVKKLYFRGQKNEKLLLVMGNAGINFINTKWTNFLFERHFGSFLHLHVTRKKLPKRLLYEKFARLTLVKLTPGIKGLKLIKKKKYSRAADWRKKFEGHSLQAKVLKAMCSMQLTLKATTITRNVPQKIKQ